MQISANLNMRLITLMPENYLHQLFELKDNHNNEHSIKINGVIFKGKDINCFYVCFQSSSSFCFWFHQQTIPSAVISAAALPERMSGGNARCLSPCFLYHQHSSTMGLGDPASKTQSWARSAQRCRRGNGASER